MAKELVEAMGRAHQAQWEQLAVMTPGMVTNE
jgi:hypothetical protein